MLPTHQSWGMGGGRDGEDTGRRREAVMGQAGKEGRRRESVSNA